jgi:hypothetical protein
MLFVPKHDPLGELEERLRRALVVTPDLMSDVIARACPRFTACRTAATAKVARLIESKAWTDAALALLELELPHWTLRRLVHEDGEWLCSLSKQPALPLGLDDVAEASHGTLPLAILLAFVEARSAAPESPVTSTTVPQVRPAAGHAVCCENFG